MSISVKDVTKRFGEFVALDHLSVEVPSGALLAIVTLVVKASLETRVPSERTHVD